MIVYGTILRQYKWTLVFARKAKFDIKYSEFVLSIQTPLFVYCHSYLRNLIFYIAIKPEFVGHKVLY